MCTANIARSPYAERRAIQLLPHAQMRVDSAGIPGYPGRPMDEHMAAQLRARQISARGHVSRSVTPDDLDAADLVLTFEYAQRLRLIESWPEHAAKVFVLHQFAEVVPRLRPGAEAAEVVAQARLIAPPDSMSWDVSDPHGLGRRAAKRCAEEIDEALIPIIRFLTGGESQGPQG